jgi:hypothetical protein
MRASARAETQELREVSGGGARGGCGNSGDSDKSGGGGAYDLQSV